MRIDLGWGQWSREEGLDYSWDGKWINKIIKNGNHYQKHSNLESKHCNSLQLLCIVEL